MIKQNVTLALSKSLLKKAKMVAASQEKSLSELLKEALEEKVREETGYKIARARQLKILNKGFDLGTGGNLNIPREELHERQ